MSITNDAQPVAAPPNQAVGRVIRSTGSWYDVQTTDGVVPSKVRGKFRLAEQTETNPVVVGDRVTIRLGDDGTGFITDIHERRNKLSRRAAGRRVGMEHVLVANVDAAWTIQSVRMPKLNPGFIDRFLVMAELYELDAGIVFNKLDLMRAKDEPHIAFWQALYEDLGYPVLGTSATNGDGVETFREALAGQTNVVAGPSGVGKSSLLNAVEPNLNLRTGAVSTRTRKGKHTTTHAQLFALGDDGFIVDTPGIREYGIVELEPAHLGHYFVEFRDFLHDCHFPNCTHDHEPGCAVKAAMLEDLITAERYTSYLNILDSLRLGNADVGR